LSRPGFRRKLLIVAAPDPVERLALDMSIVDAIASRAKAGLISIYDG
jgi:hypothetical protein